VANTKTDHKGAALDWGPSLVSMIALLLSNSLEKL